MWHPAHIKKKQTNSKKALMHRDESDRHSLGYGLMDLYVLMLFTEPIVIQRKKMRISVEPSLVQQSQKK